MLEQSWIHLLFSQCLLLCRCCLQSWLRDFGTGTSENSSGYLYCHSGQEGKIPLVFTQQYCLDLLPTSVVLKLISGSAPTQHWIWTSGSFHAVTFAASSVQGSFKSFRHFGEQGNQKKNENPAFLFSPCIFFMSFFFFCLMPVQVWLDLQLTLKCKGKESSWLVWGQNPTSKGWKGSSVERT